MSLATDVPGTYIFDEIARTLNSSEAAKDYARKNIGGIVAFALDGPGEGQWYVDAKESGQVGKGTAPEGKGPDFTVKMKAKDFESLAENIDHGPQLYVRGKLSVDGDTLLMGKLGKVLELGKPWFEVPS